MLKQIIIHTPLYVWAILAFLIYRGVLAASARELALKKLWIIPLLMLLLSLQNIGNKFGFGALPLAAWVAGASLAALAVWRYAPVRISAASTPGLVRVAGSWATLAMMLAIFATKYATAVTLAIAPSLATSALFAGAVCMLFGSFNGYFLSRVAGDTLACQALAAQGGAEAALAA